MVIYLPRPDGVVVSPIHDQPRAKLRRRRGSLFLVCTTAARNTEATVGVDSCGSKDPCTQAESINTHLWGQCLTNHGTSPPLL